jgi:ABC-type phosphate transport system substrate-binding protein
MKILQIIFLFSILTFPSFAGQAEIVVVVSAKSTVDNLDKDRVSAIFLGKTATFPDGTQAIPVEQPEGTPPHEEFHTLVTEKSGSQLKSYWSKMVFSGKGNPPKEIANNAEMLKLITGNPNMIGYIDKSAVNSSIKIVFAP